MPNLKPTTCTHYWVYRHSSITDQYKSPPFAFINHSFRNILKIDSAFFTTWSSMVGFSLGPDCLVPSLLVLVLSLSSSDDLSSLLCDPALALPAWGGVAPSGLISLTGGGESGSFEVPGLGSTSVFCFFLGESESDWTSVASSTPTFLALLDLESASWLSFLSSAVSMGQSMLVFLLLHGISVGEEKGFLYYKQVRSCSVYISFYNLVR